MKKNRHELILNFIKNNAVSTQEEIIKMLADNGHKVTQATISRDIKELKLIKEHFGKNEIKYTVSSKNDNTDNFKTILTRSALSVELAMNIIVIKCYAGTANAACMAIDNLNLSGIVGTIAGDDTIFVACKDIHYATEAMHSINLMLKG